MQNQQDITGDETKFSNFLDPKKETLQNLSFHQTLIGGMLLVGNKNNFV